MIHKKVSLQQMIMDRDLKDESGRAYDISRVKNLVMDNPKLLKEVNAEAGSKLIEEVLSGSYELADKMIRHIIKFGKVLSFLQIGLLRGSILSIEASLKFGEKPEGPKWYVESLIRCLFWSRNIDIRRDMLQLLIKYGFDTKFHNDKGKNILHFLLEYVKKSDKDSIEIAEILINSGVSVNECDSYGNSPFMFSIETRNLPVISLFIKKGGIVNWNSESTENYDFTKFPLIHAAQIDDKDVLELLLSNGADVNIKTNEGITALHQACWFGNQQSIKILLQRGADVTIQDKYGKTPFATIEPDEIFYKECVVPLIKELAKLSFENLSISEKDLTLMQKNPKIFKFFGDCKSELERMKKYKFYSFYSYYFVLKMSKNIKKVVDLTQNNEFVRKFKENLQCFKIYRNDLQRIFNDAIRAKDESKVVYSKLYLIFGDILPELVLKKMSDNLNFKDLP